MAGNRVLFLDYAKGIGILLMLFQHSIPQHNTFRIILQAFVVPIFFVIGGYVWWHKGNQGKEVRISWLYLKKRLRHLGVPYLIGCLVLALFYEFLSFSNGGNHIFFHNLFRTITLQGIDSMWFLPVYLCSEVLFLIVIGYRNKRLAIGLLILILAILHILVRFEGTVWPFALVENSLIGFLFFYSGYFSAEHRIHESPIPAVILFFLLGLMGARVNGYSSFAELHIPVLYYLDGMLLSLSIIAMCSLVKYADSFIPKAVVLFGRETLFILCSNNLIIEIIRLFDFKVTGNFLLKNGMFGNFMMFMLLCAAEGILILIFRRYIKGCKLTVHPKGNCV